MGKSGIKMLINIKDIWDSATQKSHTEYISDVLTGSLPARNPILNSLLNSHVNELALALPDVLRKIITDVQEWKAIYDPAVYEEFILDCKQLFNYGRFSDKSAKGWNAYALCKSSKYRMCPYCQQAPAVTIFRDRDSKAFRPTLDHFYAQHKYPYLALSLYNLIPSCHICNTSLKGNIDFYLHPHLHPYEDNEVIRYSFNIHSYLESRKSANSNSLPNIKIKIRRPRRSEALHKPTKRSINTFLLHEQLSLHEAEIRRFIDTLMTYSNGRMEEINNAIFQHSPWQLTESVALNFSYVDYKNEWLGCLKRDLYEAAWTRDRTTK